MTINAYRQHVFTQSAVFTIAHTPAGGYIDVLLVGGGSAGSRPMVNVMFAGRTAPGGSGGQVVYKRIYINSPRHYSVTIGQGGVGVDSLDVGNVGSPTILGDSSTVFLAKADGGVPSSSQTTYNLPIEALDSTQGTLITDGLFYDNTIYYGGNGTSIGSYAQTQSATYTILGGQDNFVGGAAGVYFESFRASPGGGYSYIDYRWNGYDGQANTGGGGGAAAPKSDVRSNYGDLYGIVGKGGSGIAIIRYPILG